MRLTKKDWNTSWSPMTMAVNATMFQTMNGSVENPMMIHRANVAPK